MIEKKIRFLKKDNCVRIIWKNFMYSDIEEREFLRVVKKHGKVKLHNEKEYLVQIEPIHQDFFLYELYEISKNNFRSILCKRKTYYIYNLPLIGHNAFGIIDRGTNLLQVRVVTGCNLNCIYCSVDEGPNSSTRNVDYIVSREAILDEIKKIIKIKKHPVEIHIDAQGEPLLYPDITSLISELREYSNIKVISMQSNSLLLYEKLIEDLAESGLSRINISLNSFDVEKASFLAGIKYFDVERVLKSVELLLENKIRVLLAPVIISGINDSEIPTFIRFAKEKLTNSEFPTLGIQKYVRHKFGRRISSHQTFYEFYKLLRQYEKIYNFRPLVLKPSHFNIRKDNTLPRKFERGEKVTAEIVLPGRLANERIGVAKDSLIQILNCRAEIGDKIKIRILSTSDGVYTAEAL